jgi:hypothetical protein
MGLQRRLSIANPYDLRLRHPELGERGMMLVPSREGKLIMVESKGYENVSPSDYNVRNPLGERSTRFRGLIMGMGQPVQTDENSQRYDHALGVDLSCGWGYKALAKSGPLTIGSGPIRQITEATLGGTRYLVVLSGTKVYVASAATIDDVGDFTLSRDFAGDGVEPSWSTLHAATGITTRFYVAMLGSGKTWCWDGTDATTTWAVCTDAKMAGPAITSRWGGTLQQLVVGGVDYAVHIPVGDPKTTASFLTINVGGPNLRVTWLTTVEDVLLIFKEIGVWGEGVITSVRGFTGGAANSLDPLLGGSPDGDHGRNAVAWQRALWVNSSGSWLKITPRRDDLALVESVGTERLVENTSEVRGPAYASAPHQTWHHYMGVYNQSTGDSYLCKYGAWLNPEQAHDPQSQYIPVIHGALDQFEGRKITAMFTSTKGSGSTPPHERLYVGMDNGDLYAYDLPRFGPYAPSDPESVYRNSGYVLLSRHSLGARTAFRGVTISGPDLDHDRPIKIFYVLDDGTERELVGDFTETGQRLDFPEELVGRSFQLKLVFEGAGSETPLFDELLLHEQLRPDSVEEIRFVVNASPIVVNRRGDRCLTTGRELRDWLLEVAHTGQDVSLATDDPAPRVASLAGLSVVLEASDQRGPASYQLAVTAVKFKDEELP